MYVFGVHRRTTASAVHKSGEKQGDHLYLGGTPHAHLPLTAHYPPATEKSPGTSGEVHTQWQYKMKSEYDRFYDHLIRRQLFQNGLL